MSAGSTNPHWIEQTPCPSCGESNVRVNARNQYRLCFSCKREFSEHEWKILTAPRSESAIAEHPTRSTLVHNGKIVGLRVDNVVLPDGTTSKREVVSHPGAAAAVAVIEDDILMVKQYRYAVGEEVLELPAGKLEPDEDPKDCIIRELQEEIRYKPSNIVRLSTIYPSPGYTSERIHLYLACGLEPSKLKADDDERLEVIRVPYDRAILNAQSGYYKDAKTCLGLILGWYSYNRHLRT